MEIDEKTLEEMKAMEPRKAYESVRLAVLANPWGSSSEDLLSAFEQVVNAGILTWEQVEGFEES